ncbi:MAG: radical SAM protein [Holophagaceae bacterium]|nr:radical SAM protein [Holophagaceae bacterium]
MALSRQLTTFKAPLYIAWEITHQCNAHCIHCYSNSGPEVCAAAELTTVEALGVVDQLADAGLLMLAFSGGEPMLRKDWPLLVKRAVVRGLGVNVGTNGSTVTSETAEQLRDLGIKSVTVSLDSDKAEVHDRIREFPGLFDRAINAIRLLVEHNVRVVIGFTPMRLNWQDGPRVIQLALSLGADAVNLSEYVPAGRGNVDLALSPPMLRDLLTQWIHLREYFEGQIQIIWHDCRVGMLVPEKDRRDYLGCGAGRLVARILPDGVMTPCVFLPTPMGSFLKSTFSEMWCGSSLAAQFRERKGHFKGNCGDCEYLESCGGCRAVAYAYSHGDPLAGDPHCWVKPEDSSPLPQLIDGEGLPI